MTKKIIIVGGGIAGLTTAHELLKKGFEVHLFERTSELGGMAKATRNKDGIMEEYSWRGYGPFYNNFFDILKQIPIYNTHKPLHPLLKKEDKPCAINNLTHGGINFITFKNDDVFVYSGNLEYTQHLKGLYDMLKYVCSNKRREKYHKILLKDYMTQHYNEHSYDVIVNHLAGPCLGFNRNTIGINTMFDTITKVMINSNMDSSKTWRNTTRPTSEAIFDPWLKHLTSHENFNVYFNSSLVKINNQNNKIVSLTININGTIKKITGDEYVISINPFNLQNILISSNLLSLANINDKVINNSVNNQISFRIGFNKKVRCHKENAGFTFLDSYLNITLYPVETTWDKDVPIDNDGKIKSLWSGTVVDTMTVIPKYNKIGNKLTREELIEEILDEIFISKSFNDYIYRYNNYNITRDDICYLEVFKEYIYINGELENIDNKKWVNNIFNEISTIEQQTEYTNMYIGGAHTKTSLNKYSMEAATESGKIVANHILTKYNLEKCYHYVFDNRYLHQIDDILYAMKCPNIIDVISICIVLLIIIKLYKHKYTITKSIKNQSYFSKNINTIKRIIK
jgi:protoporphyrinogen oxidase